MFTKFKAFLSTLLFMLIYLTANNAFAVNWTQVNTGGFGNVNNIQVLPSVTFDGYLYAAVRNETSGGEIWRSADGTTWNLVVSGGFNDADNLSLETFLVFGNYLYAGVTDNAVTGCEIWRSANGTSFEKVSPDGFGNKNNKNVSVGRFGDYLYAGTDKDDSGGGELWRSADGTNWESVTTTGFGNADNEHIYARSINNEFGSYMYVGTENEVTGCEIWRSIDGTNWQKVIANGFGDRNNESIFVITVFMNYLYAGTENAVTGGEVWRSSDGINWEQVNTDGFGDRNNTFIVPTLVFDGGLYAGTQNAVTGGEVWRSADGINWEQFNTDGFGNPGNVFIITTAIWDNSLYAGTNNSVTGGEIWKTISAGDPPDKPTLSLPVNNATGVSLTPTLQTENFSDPDSGDTHSQTQWQISTVDDFSTDLLNVTRTSHLTSLTVPHQTLNEGTIYYWRVRFYDNDSNASEWSDAFSFTTLTTTNDQNANGIPDNQENETVDLDNDGTADIVQDDIKSLNTVVGDGQMGVSRKDEPNITSIESIESIDPDTISQTAIPYSIPLGLFTMNLNVANAGDSVQATVYFSEAAPVNGRWFKYDSINGWQNYSEYATFSSDRKSVILELRDGGHGDADGVANGVIVDPGGFGLASWIEGYVSDVSTGQAIKSAVISILNLTMTTMSDGHYLSMILPGTYSCSVSASGYQTINKTIEVSEGSILNYNFKMAAVGSGGDSSGGSVNVYFPHIAGDGTWETEICVVNTSSQQNLSGEFTAYSHSGQKVDSTSVFLSPKGRRSIVVGDEFSSASNIGYIIFESDSQNLRGYLKFYINGKYRVAIPAASDVNTGDIYISHIASDDNWTTGISILNTTSASKDLPIEFDNGMTKTLTIAANEHKAFTISGLFDGQPQPGINSAVIKNGNGIVGLEIFGTTESSGLSYLSGILLKDDTTSTIYYPHIASDETWSTGVVAYNPSDTSCELAITPYSVNGTPLSPQMLSIDGKRKCIGTVDGLDLPDGTAWFSIEAASPITGFELFSTKDGNQLGGYTGVGISGKDGVFVKIDKEGTGIAFVNIEDFSATVTMTAYDDSGNVIATETVNLIDHEKKVDVPSSLFSEDISTATYIAYSSTGNVVGFQLNVSADGMMLDALPGM